MNHLMNGFIDELVKISGPLDSTKAVPRMPPVPGGKPQYRAQGGFKIQTPKVEHPGAMKSA